MLNGIAPFRISVKSVEGKWKLSQNHPKHAVDSAAEELFNLGTRDSSEIGRLMKEAKGKMDGAKP